MEKRERQLLAALQGASCLTADQLAANQCEGAYLEDGKGMSVADMARFKPAVDVKDFKKHHAGMGTGTDNGKTDGSRDGSHKRTYS